MTIQYVHHSCYLAEGENAIVVFDYWADPQSVLQQKLSTSQKTLYYVVSHFHEDHYNADILNQADAKIIISYDTKKRRHVKEDQCLAVLHPDETFEDENVKIVAYKSTDVGLAYILEMEGDVAFHAGDLNNWYFDEGNEKLKVSAHEMEGLYLSTIKRIAKDYPKVNHLMFPIDPRLGVHTLRGVCQWLRMIHTKVLYPMHTWEQNIDDYISQIKDSFPDLEIVW